MTRILTDDGHLDVEAPQWSRSPEAPVTLSTPSRPQFQHGLAAMEPEPGGSGDEVVEAATGTQEDMPQWSRSPEAPVTTK